MNKLINKPESIAAEMLDGYLSVYPGLYKRIPEKAGKYLGFAVKNVQDRVSVVIGGGSGNEPWVLGYVGEGLADAAVLGQVYAAPPAKALLAVTKSIEHAKGVVFVAANHSGDVLNFELACELAAMEGIQCDCVFAADDVTSDSHENRKNRRGVAGVTLAVKIAGAAASAGLCFSEVMRITKKAVENLYTCGVTTSSGYTPIDGTAMCDLQSGEIAYGMGFNGESGVLQTALPSADEVACTLLNFLFDEVGTGDEVAVMINGFGFTSRLELCIVSRKIRQLLENEKITVYDMFIDEMFCPQGTGGLSVSILKLDKELKEYYNKPAYSPFCKQFIRRGHI